MSFRMLTSTALAILSLTASALTAPASAQVLTAPLVALAPNDPVAALKPDVLSVIPDDAYGFTVGSKLKDTKATVEKVCEKLQIPLDDPDYAEFNAFVESVKGWDSEGEHAFALVPDDDGDPEPLVFIAVTDYDAFAKSLGAESPGSEPTRFRHEAGLRGMIAKKASFAVFTETGNEDLLRKVVASKTSVASTVGPVRQWLGKHQVGLVVTPNGLKTSLDAAIDGLQQAKQFMPAAGPQAALVGNVFDVYIDLLTTIRDEVTLVSVGGNIDAEVGLTAVVRADFKPDGVLAAAAKGVSPLPANALQGLPEGEFFVAGAGIYSGGAMDGLMRFSMGMARNLPPELGGMQLTDEEFEQVMDAMHESMSQVKSLSAKFDLSGKSMLQNSSVILETTDAKTFLKTYEDAVTTLGGLLREKAGAVWPEQNAKRITIDGNEVLEITTDVSKMLDKMGNNQPEEAKKMVQAMMSMFIGTEGKVSTYVAAADNDTVVMSYDRDTLTKLIAGAKQGQTGLGNDAQLTKTAAMLPGEAHMVGYLSIGGYVDLIKKFLDVAKEAKGGAFFPTIPDFPAAPPVGASIRLSATSVETTIAVPMALMEAGRDYVQAIRVAN